VMYEFSGLKKSFGTSSKKASSLQLVYDSMRAAKRHIFIIFDFMIFNDFKKLKCGQFYRGHFENTPSVSSARDDCFYLKG
jgi:hypothetical protein